MPSASAISNMRRNNDTLFADDPGTEIGSGAAVITRADTWVAQHYLSSFVLHCF